MDSILSWFILTVLVVISCMRFVIKAIKEYDEYRKHVRYEDDKMWSNLK